MLTKKFAISLRSWHLFASHFSIAGSFYHACKALLESMDKILEGIFSDSAAAKRMATSTKDKTTEFAQQDIATHAKVGPGKSKEEQQDARAMAIAGA